MIDRRRHYKPHGVLRLAIKDVAIMLAVLAALLFFAGFVQAATVIATWDHADPATVVSYDAEIEAQGTGFKGSKTLTEAGPDSRTAQWQRGPGLYRIRVRAANQVGPSEWVYSEWARVDAPPPTGGPPVPPALTVTITISP